MLKVRPWIHVLVLAVLLALLLVAPMASALPRTAPQELQGKVSVNLLEELAANGTALFFVVMREQADLSGAAALPTKLAKGAFVFDALTSTAERTQADLLATLSARGIAYKSFFISNMILLQGDLALVNEMAARADVGSVEANTAHQFVLPRPEDGASGAAPLAVEPGLIRIKAPDVWALGFHGEGIVVASGDTGVQWDHPAIKSQYRGWDGSVADHNYNWHDGTCASSPFIPPGNNCLWQLVPTDTHGHGTHTTGTMVGDDGAGNQIGAAPGAKWVACKNMNDQGWGTRAWYADCFQFFIAPTTLVGTNPNPALAPDVINNSWGCPPTSGGENCDDPANDLVNEVNATRAAGIMVVASAGNSGSACGTVNTPIAIYDAVYTVGAFSAPTGVIASFSSRGPAAFTNLLKPDIAAPGVSVRSSLVGSTYGSLSGTSMASPHVAGALALLWSAHAFLVGDIDATETLFNSTATPRTATQDCGGVPGTTIPNNTWGHGEINVLAAVQAAQPTALTVSGLDAQTLPGNALLVVMAAAVLAAAGALAWRVRRPTA
ncbi:MAG: S8 family serine peptidase [Anaerolineae bacterium]